MKSGANHLIRFYFGRLWIALAALLVFSGGSRLSAQFPSGSNSWALRMFTEAGTEMTRNFGDLALHSEAEQRFKFRNIYKEDVVILSAQSSCSCTNVTVPKKVIKSGETGEIVARVDTSGKVHVGKRKATVTVHFSQPYPAEVQMQVMSHIRADVVFDPGVVEFGSVGQGVPVTKTVYLQYNGQLTNWQLVGMKKNSPAIRAEAKVVSRNGNRKTYKVDVQLLPTAEPGYISDLLRFTSNEAGSSGIFVPVHGQVISALSVKPTYLQFGVIHPSESATRNLVVRGSTPFQIVSVQSDDPRMEFKTAKQESTVHVIPVTLTAAADETPGEFRKSIRVKTTISELPALDIAVFGIISDEPVSSAETSPESIVSAAEIQEALGEYRLIQDGPVLGGFDAETQTALFVPAKTESAAPSAVDAAPTDDLPIPASISRKFGHRYLAPQKIDGEEQTEDSLEESQLASTDAPAVPFTFEERQVDRTAPRAETPVREGEDESSAERQITIAAPEGDGEELLSFELADKTEEAESATESEPTPAEAQAFTAPKQEHPLSVNPETGSDENGWFPANNAATPQKTDKKTASPGRKKVAALDGISFRRPDLR